MTTATAPAATGSHAAPTATATTDVTLVDWYAEWCHPCHAMTPILEEIEKEYAGRVTIEKIDVDKNQELAFQNGVMSMPTFHVKKGGKVLQSIVGFQSKQALAKVLDAALGPVN